MTRHLHHDINMLSWDSFVQIDDFSIKELQFWITSFKSLPNCVLAPIQRLPERLAFTDVSSYAGAGYVVHFSYTSNIVHRMWTNEERLKSSTWRELKAVVLTLKGFSDHFQNKFVKLFTDNQNVARIYEVGSMKKDQHELAPEIFLFLHKKVNLFKNRMDP